jgi:type IV secretion system protein VirB8
MSKEQFYKTSRDWSYSLYHSHTLWLRRLLVLIVGLILLLIGSVATNVLLVPLKDNVPYLYAFDQATGEITKIGSLEKTTFSDNWELARYFLIHYVVNYESYNSDNMDLPYQLVWAQSSEEMRKRFETQMNSSNADSPYKRFGKDKFITVKVTSVNRLNDNTVDIKFQKTLHDKTTNTEQVNYKEAIVKWQFTQAETTQKMLDRDPLGFKVNYYQTTQVTVGGNV